MIICTLILAVLSVLVAIDTDEHDRPDTTQ
jgi:hypothetical protein